MRKSFLFAFLFLFVGAAGVFELSAQTPGPSPAASSAGAVSTIKPNLAAGEVTAISAADSKISLQTNDGAIDVVLSGATVYKKVSAQNPSLASATDAALADIGVGDKILVTGKVSDDKKTIPAKNVYLMTKADISKKNEAERAAWRARGISGRVISLNPNTREFTIAVRGMAGEQNVVVSPKENVNYRRYAADSVKFDDARASSFAELQVGDQVRALGDRSPDNTSFKAEQVLSGAFKMVGGTITAVDAAKNEITIKELQTNKPVTIVVSDATMLRKFPAEMATAMAMRLSGGGMQPPGGAPGGNVMVRPPQQPGAGQPAAGGGQPVVVQGGGGPPSGGGMRMSGGRPGDVDDMLERLPTISVADLKVGDAIAISSSSTAPDRYRAIKLVAGVEPFFRAPQMPGGAPGRNNQPQINIPGLDGGFGTP